MNADQIDYMRAFRRLTANNTWMQAADICNASICIRLGKRLRAQGMTDQGMATLKKIAIGDYLRVNERNDGGDAA